MRKPSSQERNNGAWRRPMGKAYEGVSWWVNALPVLRRLTSTGPEDRDTMRVAGDWWWVLLSKVELRAGWADKVGSSGGRSFV